jgi:hypothetical protein
MRHLQCITYSQESTGGGATIEMKTITTGEKRGNMKETVTATVVRECLDVIKAVDPECFEKCETALLNHFNIAPPMSIEDFDTASSHPYLCKCSLCEQWWQLVGPEDEDQLS